MKLKPQKRSSGGLQELESRLGQAIAYVEMSREAVLLNTGKALNPIHIAGLLEEANALVISVQEAIQEARRMGMM